MKTRVLLIVALLAGLSVGCSSDPTAPPEESKPDTSNALDYGGERYALSAGLAEYEGGRDPYHVNIGATDGSYYPTFIPYLDTTLTVWKAADAQVDVRARLFSVGGDAFRAGTFVYEGESGEPPAGTSYFDQAYVGIDTDGDGDIARREEIAVLDGTITVSGTQPNFSVTYALKLENGLSATGGYAGTYLVVED